MANYLVTGVAGFIGAKVAELLLADNHTVVGLDNLNDAYDPRLKNWRLAQLAEKPGFYFSQLDIMNRTSLSQFWQSQTIPFDAVINLAARAGVRQSVENPWIYFDTNTTGTLNLLDLCKEHSVNKFVLASTSSLYGQRNPMPYQEDADTNHPLSPYAASKKAAEALCYTYHFLYGIDITIFRYFTVYGPAGRPDMSLFRFVKWVSEGQPVLVYGDGLQSRDFTYVDDIARGTIAGLKPLGYEVINLGSDQPAKLMDALHIVEQLVGKKAQIDFQPMPRSDVTATWADISKARHLLNWQPQLELKHGITKLVHWYHQNRDLVHSLTTA